jgi:hypothetical protein
VAHTGDGAQSHHHLLVDDEHGNEEGQGPQQRQPEVLAGLGVGRDATGVVVAHHDDKARPDDRHEREEACSGAAARSRFVLFDGAEGTLDLILRCFAHASSFLFS